ncbi:hypothetical protein DPMN_015762 [Dreissena polymorpha]|uniref:Uncharacterized protein n=1 Tax=Dreissena polymorpha TaxID=45954 RepID=A0A9D4NE93_DREPO|nr:hypothetical protein DPMN_015691 [Dreissena polymorpha]KAH3891657.1 hypothetical protein DPMN_015762 [Dreissena polymorpha]
MTSCTSLCIHNQPVLIDVVLSLWDPSREIQCRALSLERVHPQLLGVPPSFHNKPREEEE